MKTKQRWRNYQVDAAKYGGSKLVKDLTETEAKDELCDAMELIDRLLSHTYVSFSKTEELAKKFGYL